MLFRDRALIYSPETPKASVLIFLQRAVPVYGFDSNDWSAANECCWYRAWGKHRVFDNYRIGKITVHFLSLLIELNVMKPQTILCQFMYGRFYAYRKRLIQKHPAWKFDRAPITVKHDLFTFVHLAGRMELSEWRQFLVNNRSFNGSSPNSFNPSYS